MAKKRRFRKYIRGSIEHSLSLGTLAAKVAVASDNSEILTEKAWCSSVLLRWSLSNFTPNAGDGPILVGVAHSDYSSSEIEEWIENVQDWAEEDQIGQERGRRKIKQVGMFDIPPDTTASTAMVLNDGKPIRTKCGWQLRTGQTMKFWAYNKGTSALATTSPIVGADGHANLWPN